VPRDAGLAVHHIDADHGRLHTLDDVSERNRRPTEHFGSRALGPLGLNRYRRRNGDQRECTDTRHSRNERGPCAAREPNDRAELFVFDRHARLLSFRSLDALAWTEYLGSLALRRCFWN